MHFLKELLIDRLPLAVEGVKMDFELTKSQKEIQKAARDFTKGEFG